jgi:hypothetical protein
VDVNDTITVSLTAQQWEGVMNAMSEAPFRLAAPLIAAIQKQAMAQRGPSNGAALPPATPPDNSRSHADA